MSFRWPVGGPPIVGVNRDVVLVIACDAETVDWLLLYLPSGDLFTSDIQLEFDQIRARAALGEGRDGG